MLCLTEYIRHQKKAKVKAEIKEEILTKIKQVYKFDFKDGIKMKKIEHPNPMGTTFYEFDLEEVLVQHNNPVFISSSIGESRISRLLVNKEVIYLSFT